MGVFGCAVTHTLPMNNVEKIEVIRGPESVLYGSEAFGGIINIITKKNQEEH
jgi:outer membrane receptor for ferrienterochelin and colicin